MTDVSKILTGLQPGANYVVQVRSKSNAGETSDWSTTYSFSTPSTTVTTINNSLVQSLGAGYIYVGDPALAIDPNPQISQPTSPFVVISKDGIQGGPTYTDPSFTLSTASGGAVQIAAFMVQKTDLVLPSTFTINNLSLTTNSKNFFFYIPSTYYASVNPYMLLSDNNSRIQANTYVSDKKLGTGTGTGGNGISTSSAVVYLSSSIVSTGSSNVTFRAPAAKFRVGTTASNAITIQGPNSVALDSPASIFTTINNVSTTASSNSGFYLDETGKFRFAGSAGYISTDGAGNLIMSGSVTAASGNIGGWTIVPNALYSNIAAGSFAGVSPGTLTGSSANYVFWAGNSDPSLAPFAVKTDGSIVASKLAVSASLVVGGSAGAYAGINPSSGTAIFAGATASTGAGASFYVTNTGSVYATAASFSGPIITNGTVTGTTTGTSASLVGAAIFIPNTTTPSFKVDSSGNMTASNAYLSGSIVSNSGSIGGWQINTGSLTSGTGASAVGLTTGTYAIYAGSATASSAPFSVTNTGSLVASSASITGNITANTLVANSSGSIAGWTISSSALTSGNVGLTTGTYSFYSGNATASSAPFNVTNTGVLTATNANISGSITATTGSIGGFAITGSALYGGPSGSVVGFNPYNASAAIFAGATSSAGAGASFRVTNSGSVYANAASLTGPIIANGVLSGGSITGTSISVGSPTPVFTVDSSGNMTATSASISGSIVANSGSITGTLNIGPSGLFTAGTAGAQVVNISGKGITGASAGIPTFTLPTDGTSPTIGSFKVVQTGLQSVGQVVGVSASGTSGNPIVVVAASTASTLWAGMSASGAGIANGSLITSISSGSITLSINASATFSGSPVNFIPNANFVIGTSASTNITIRGASAVGIPAAFFNVNSGTAMTYGNSGFAGFYLDENGAFWLSQGAGQYFAASGGNVAVSGSIVSSAGSIGGWQINTGSLTSGTGASAVGLTTGSIAIYAGSSTGSAAPFIVTNTGNLTATNANISGSITANSGSIGGWVISPQTLSSSITVSPAIDIYLSTYDANYSTASALYTGFYSTNTSSNNAIFAGATTASGDNAAFSVTPAGVLTAASATIRGTINGLTVGFGGPNSNATNTAIGIAALNSDILGNYNVALGASALILDTYGSNNIGLGYQSLALENLGNRNTAIGTQALYNSPIGSDNVAIGTNALLNNTGPLSSTNIAIGTSALKNNVSIDYYTGFANVAIGNYSMGSASNYGQQNVAIGNYTMQNNASGDYSVAIGPYALSNNTSGDYNIAIGANSLFSNIAGSRNVAIGASALNSYSDPTILYSDNVALGTQSMLFAASGIGNIALGINALRSGSVGSTGYYVSTNSGNLNVAIGNNTLLNNNANRNIAIGDSALYSNTTGSVNVAIGTNTMFNSIIGYSNVVIGNNAAVSASNSFHHNVIIGESSLYSADFAFDNIAIGSSAMYYLSGGGATNYNIAIGYQAFSSASLGLNNVAIGYLALSGSIALARNNVAIGNSTLASASGNVVSNVAVGNGALSTVTSGDGNVGIGTSAGPTSGSLSNTIAIGTSAAPSQNYQIVIGQAGAASATQIAGASVNLGDWISYTPAWTSTSPPSIGNGSITGAYCVIGRQCSFWINITFGTTTTFGSGAYTTTLPIIPAAVTNRLNFGGWIFQGGALYNIFGQANNSTTMQIYYINNGTTSQVTNVTGTAPVALTASSTNSISINGTYQI